MKNKISPILQYSVDFLCHAKYMKIVEISAYIHAFCVMYFSLSLRRKGVKERLKEKTPILQYSVDFFVTQKYTEIEEMLFQRISANSS